MTGEDWYKSPQFKLLRVIGHLLHQDRISDIVDLVESVIELYPGAELKTHVDALSKSLNDLEECKKKVGNCMRDLTELLSPKRNDYYVCFSDSEVSSHPNMWRPIDRDMARVILTALSVAEHESQIDYEDEITQRIVRMIKAAYPDLELGQ